LGEDVAQHIDVSDIMDHIDWDGVYEAIGHRVNGRDVAEYIDVQEVAENVSIDLETISPALSQLDLALVAIRQALTMAIDKGTREFIKENPDEERLTDPTGAN